LRLDIPPSLITVDSGSAACAWASDFSEKVTVELTLHQLCTPAAVAGLASPNDLAASIVSQHGDASSRLWRGYLTKTLDKNAVRIEKIEASTAESTCSLNTNAPNDAANPTDTPTTEVSGALSFSMDSAAAASVAAKFSDASTKAEVSAAFSKTIAESLSGVEASDVEIVSITASRRLSSTSSRALASANLDVDYIIRTTADAASAVNTAIVAVDTTAFATSLTTELQQVQGLESVTVDSMATPAAPTVVDKAATASPTTAATTAPTDVSDATTEAPIDVGDVDELSSASLVALAAIGLMF
jgi:hypothetical protein